MQPGAEPFRHEGGPVGVLLIHGFTGSPVSMRPWAEHLAQAGLSVNLPRLPGHGTSWQEMNRTRWPDWYAEVERAFDDLRGRCDEVFVTGLSMGGTLALRLAEERGDDISGITLVNPSVLSTNPRMKVIGVLKWIVPSVKGVGEDIKKDGVSEGAYTRTPLKAADSLRDLWALVRADLAKITQPVLLFRCEDDHVCEPANAQVILEGISSADVDQRLLHDSYHVATLDNDAPAIFSGTLDFVRAHSRVLSAGG